MKLIKQKRGDWYCGHCSVAMVTDSPVDEVIGGMGKLKDNGGATASMLIDYTKSIGYEVRAQYPVDNRKPISLDGRGILLVAGTRGLSHAVAYENGVIYDPDNDTYDGIKAMKQDYKKWSSRVRVFAKIEVEAK